MTDCQTDKFKFFEGKRVQLITKSGLRYNTSNLQVIDGSIVFTDKFGLRVMVACDEIARVEELR